MSGRKKSNTGKTPAGGASVTVCRGCCCGRTEKNPGTDHAGQLAALRQRLGTARVRVSDCLDVCEQSNVIIVSPAPAGRAQGARPVWLGLVHEPDAVTEIADWVQAGGPGIAEPPPILDLYRFAPSRRVRAESGIDQ